MRVGIIGLGRMGSGIAERMIAAGFSLAVYTRSSEKARSLGEAGIALAKTPADLARICDVIVLSVRTTHDVEAVLFGAEGVIEGAQCGLIVIDTSTISPLATRDFATRLVGQGIDLLDSPVSGGSEGARQGTLSAMVGGDARTLERARPILAAFAKTITHMGDVGAGQAAKLINQVVLVGNILAMSEGLLFAQRYGLNLETMLPALQAGAAGSWMLNHLAPKVIAQDWTPAFTIELQLKDLRIALDTADQYGVPLIGTGLIFQLYRALAAQGYGQQGNHALIRALEALSPPASNEV